ncbi:hypothetical protein NC653_002571 [Populus alba x Populus x berolinensis]|uniref:Uncharacterized protein n=1 Tax=Populus alba x Populus x berolinensis TaxID=444605 RepID=A0AAD6RPG4_9ROSI|nr:hypothetical protein NC653_002571 [Populus alba x Populus x berolinensis]
MKFHRWHPHRLVLNPIPIFQTKPKHLYCTSAIQDNDVKDSQFIATLRNIVRGKESWKIAFNDPFISTKLKPHHVEKVLLLTLDDTRITGMKLKEALPFYSSE